MLRTEQTPGKTYRLQALARGAGGYQPLLKGQVRKAARASATLRGADQRKELAPSSIAGGVHRSRQF